MQHHISQAKHNEEFLLILETHCPDKFFDWKITIVFYSALHWLRALEKSKGLNFGQSHKETIKNIKPNGGGLMPLSRGCFDAYTDLFDSARNSRYAGFVKASDFLALMKYEYERAQTNLGVVKAYCIANGVKP